MRAKNPFHARSHDPGGSDPVMFAWEDVGAGAGGSSGGIQFDTYPQDGGWLYIETTNDAGSPGGFGIQLNSQDNDGIWIHADNWDLLLESGHNVVINGDDAVTLAAPAIDIAAGASDLTMTSTSQISMNSVNSTVLVDGGGGIVLQTVAGAVFSTSEKVNLQGDVRVGLPGPSGGVDGRVQIVDEGGNALFEVRSDGTFHLLTGGTWVADL